MLRIFFKTAILVFIITGCATLSTSSKPLSSGIDLANFDRSVRPQDDFYVYVNGSWLEKTEIPADRSNYGSFTVLFEESQRQLRSIIEEVAADRNNVTGSERQKVGDFYLSYLDTASIRAKGSEPIREQLGWIAAVKSREELVRVLIKLEVAGIQDPLGFYIDQDAKDTQRYALYVTQSGLGLPDRDYYFKEDQRFQEIRAAYTDYIEVLLSLGGQDASEAKALRIMEIETALAKHHWTATENRDRDKTYNKTTIEELQAAVPGFDWPTFLDGIGGGAVDYLIVRQPSYLDGFNQVFGNVSIRDWKDYLTFKLLHGAAPFLSEDFVEAHFDFTGRTLQGISEIRPRWKRAVSMINGTMGEAVGKIYVERHFPAEAKERMVQLVANLESAFLDRLERLDWMGEATKAEARAKMSQFGKKIGYPDVWKEYSALEITPDDLITNVTNIRQYIHYREIGKLGGEIDRTEWFMTPQTVNAYYNPSMNEIVFPAAILQPPFFNLAADDAVNYGAIGAVIGHEISHGFDDQGRKSDGSGNLREWWTPEDELEFEHRAENMIKQYNGYNPIDSLHVNGALTLGENIGDLGGVLIAYVAYKNSLGDGEAPVIDGLTGDQRFFIGWAQIWRRLYRDDELRRRLVVDPHSPSRYRVIGILSNIDVFYKAFDVQPGDGMYIPEEARVRIW